ncbi:MAG TPA: hypothetical protein PLK99_09620, partial [Burkholderiales bacterium]|nr:hypothetical protein [Burkholderiales bacterium]
MKTLRIIACSKDDPPRMQEGIAIDLAADAAMIFTDGGETLPAELHDSCKIPALLGIRNVFLVPGKETASPVIPEICEKLAKEFGFLSVAAIPAKEFAPTAVYERLDKIADLDEASFRMPVESKDPAGGYKGRIASGRVKPGDRVRVSGEESRIRFIESPDGICNEASCGDMVTIRLDDPVELERGDVISSALDPVELSDQFEAKVICLSGHL